MDQVVARKLISMTTDSDSDEPNSPGTMGNKNSDSEPVITRNHTPGMNGSVVVDTSTLNAGRHSPNVSSLSAGNANPKLGNGSPIAGKGRPSADNSPVQIRKNSSAGNESPIAGQDNPMADRDSPITENPIPKTDSKSAIPATGNPAAISPDVSDSEQPNTTSSRQALLSSSESSS